MKTQPTTRHWTELSAYMDGQLPPKVAARLEKRLSRDSKLHAEYEDLLRMRKMLRSLPPRRVPRNFTLTPDMVRAPRRHRRGFLVPALRISSSFAAFMLVLTFAADFMGNMTKLGTMAQESTPMPAMEMMLEEVPADMAVEEYTAEAEEEPMILLWDEQPEPGLGGGQVPAEEAPMADTVAEGEAMPMEESAPAAEAPILAEAEEAPPAMAMEVPAEEAPEAVNAVPPATATAPLGTERAIIEEEAPMEKAVTTDETHEEQALDTGEDSVILGIPPEEEQGQIQVIEPPTPVPDPIPVERGLMPVRRWLQIGLAVFAVVAMLISFLIPRKRR
jgi:hypothetical protein